MNFVPMNTRIITRPDFDGVVCAVLLQVALGDGIPVVWVQPNEMQNGLIDLTPRDVVANLPLQSDAAFWFDHHVSNAPDHDFNYKGLYRIAPSAAGLVHSYFNDILRGRYVELVRQADRIDAACLTLDEILHPERYPYVLLSMTIVVREPADLVYCDRLVELLKAAPIEKVMDEPVVRQRCREAMALNRAYGACLEQHTVERGHVSITDLRGISPVPDGNRFLVYSLFPQSVVNVKLFHEADYTVVKLGHSILNRGCRVNVGQLLKRYGGGGHRGAGACRFERDKADTPINDIIDVLLRNQAS